MKNLYLSIIAMIALVVGANSPLEAQQKEVKKAIPVAGASVLHSEIEFPVGNLRVKPTSGRTTKCIFQFRKDDWEPEVHYNKEGDEGYLKISSEGGVNFDFDDDRHSGYEKEDQSNWGILFPSEVPHDLDIEMLAGNAKIDLENSRLGDFEFSMTAGEAEINLRNTSVPDVDFKALAGEATLDFSGLWNNDLHADIRGGFGSITIKLPSNMGVELDISGILGDVDAPRMRKEGNTYYNKAFGETPHTLYLDVNGGIGDISVEWMDD